MAEPSQQNSSEPPPVVRPEGVTASERYLWKLCQRTFLSLWSYPGIYRDQGKAHGKGDGKEVCDLLVVFENHVLIFSDKECRFGDSEDVQLDWGRWYKKAIQKSAEQLWGAERWIRQFPDRLFLDRQCSHPFPIKLPDPKLAIYHRILVAHDGSRRCREVLGGSGSLMIDNSRIGEAHLSEPFTVGQVDANRGFIHVFDDTTLDSVMNTLDTISDFTQYLAKKEKFLNSGKTVRAAGEEELLAIYLHDLNEHHEHDFIIKGNYDVLAFQEGFWEKFINSTERIAQVEANQISYSWDKLIEKFAFHAMTGTEYFTSGRPLRDQEKMYRLLAREPRTRRRALAISLHEVLRRSIDSKAPWEARVMLSQNPNDPIYVFLALKRKPGLSDDEYRKRRSHLLSGYCHAATCTYPQINDVVGIATEDGNPQPRSEDLIYLDTSAWGKKEMQRARQIKEQLGILKKVRPTFNRTYEYPVNHSGYIRRTPL